MSGKTSRSKGARGEREVRDVLKALGVHARRDGRLDDDLDHGLEGYHLEVKRRERYEIDSWVEQAEEDAGDRVPVVVFRKSRQPWRVIVDAEVFFRLVTNQQREARDGSQGIEEAARP